MDFMMKNWYLFDLNYKIINNLKKNKIRKSRKDIIKVRMNNDFQLKIKTD